jgi:F-type H+-transporting ATPase subunit epsilon
VERTDDVHESTAKTVLVRVISPTRELLAERAVSVAFPAFDGSWGVLPAHAPMIALLGTGVVSLNLPGGGSRSVAIRGGFAKVAHDEVIILSPEVAAAGEVAAEALDREFEIAAAEKPRDADGRQKRAERLAWIAARRRLIGGAAEQR